MSANDILGVVYTSLQLALMASVRYWLYQDSLRVPARRMYAAMALIALGGGTVWLLAGGFPGMDYSLYRLLLAAALFLLSCYVIREPFAKHAFAYAFIMAYDAALEATANFAQNRLLPAGPVYVYAAVMVMLLVATFVPATRTLKRMIDRLSAVENDSVWGWLCLCCYSFLFMNLAVTYPPPADMSLVLPLSRYLMLLGMIGMYLAAKRLMEAMRQWAEARANLALTERRVAMQQAYYDRLVTQMDEVRRMRHDLRHHRAALSALLNAGDREALSAYLAAAGPAEEPLPLTGNLALDGVLTFSFDAAKTLGARVETEILLGEPAPLSDPDLCVVLGNLLENALEAQKYLPEGERWLRVRARCDASGFVLAVDNRFDGTLMGGAGAYLSRKDGLGHGLGLASVRAVCEKYGGILQIETEGDLFMAGVVIGL